MDALARKFAATHDMKVKEEIERLAAEYGKAQAALGLRKKTSHRIEVMTF